MAIQTFTAGQILTAAQQNALQANDYNWTVSNKTASYVLVAADKGTRIVMSNAAATTITVNTGLFSAGDTLFIQNIGAGTCTITAGTATVTTASSLALAQWGGGTLYFTSASAAIFFSGGGAIYGTATGGSSSSITVGGINYTLLTFTTDANLVVSKSGLFDVLLVGGGGGGGSGTTGGGGGGGGGVIGIQATQTIYLTAATYAVDVGAGGAASSVGLNSAIASILAVPGGGYGGSAVAGIGIGNSGASGGGGSDNRAAGQSCFLLGGNNGGLSSGSPFVGAGGGGAGGTGGNTSGSTGGTGGNGRDISAFITGSTYYASAGGGGGSSGTGGSAGQGGVAGTTGAGNNGVNYGAGGGGGVSSGGFGAAGVVYVRFKA